MVSRCAPKLLVPLLLSLASGFAGAACVPVVGTVILTPEQAPACTIRSEAEPGTPAESFSGQCFKVKLSLAGFPVATGYAGVTMEPLANPFLGSATVTPAVIPVSTAVPIPRQVIQTARSAVWLGGTKIYTTDVAVIQPQLDSNGQMLAVPKAVTEQILIAGTDKNGAYANVSGQLHVLGFSVGRYAPVAGQICLP